MIGVKLYYGGPVKPSDDAFIDAFTGRFQQEFRNENRFLPLEDAEVKAEAWRRHYNGERPHSELGNVSSREFAALAATGNWPAILAV